jgi:hypothetical protein
VIVDAFCVAVQEAGDDPVRRQRLGMAAVTVGVEVRDVPGRRIVITLTPDHVSADDDAGQRVDVEMSLRSLDLHEIFVGGRPLPMKVAVGDVTYRGQVRRFLRVIAPLAELRTFYRAAVDGALERYEGGSL